jgi:hypothetical protein
MTYATLDRGQSSTEDLPSDGSGALDRLVVKNVRERLSVSKRETYNTTGLGYVPSRESKRCKIYKTQ